MTLWRSTGIGQYRTSEKHILIARKGYNGSKTAVLYCPSRGNTAAQAIAIGWFDQVINVVADAGYPVLAGDLGGTTTWGNDTAQTALGELRTYAGSPFLADIDQVVLMGTSMGSLLALNWARANPTLTACVVAALPLTDVIDVHDNNRGSYATEIETAYGGSSAWNTAKADHNPASNATDYTDIPHKLWYSTNDSIIPSSTVTDFVADSGGEAVSLGAVGHDPTSVDGDDVLAFIDANT